MRFSCSAAAVRTTGFAVLLMAAGTGRTDPPTAAPLPLPPGPTPLEKQMFDTPARELGYALGYRIGQRIIADHKAMGTPLDAAALGRGLADAVREAPAQLDDAGFRRVLAVFEKRMEERDQELAARMAVTAKENLARGLKFLTANAKRPGVTVLPSGLQYEVIKEASGPRPGLEDVVKARYRGTRIDGTEFDGTEPEGEPAAFPMRGVVPGWQEALQKMAVGSKWRIWLPPELAYGEAGSPPAIEPNEVLTFEIELVAIDRDRD